MVLKLSLEFLLGLLLIAIGRLLFPNALLFESIFICAFIIILLDFTISHFLAPTKWPRSLIAALLVFLLILNVGFLVLMNVDRSRSFYVLCWSGNSSTIVQIESKSIDKLGSVEVAGIKQRLSEQEMRGLIQFRNGEYSLTRGGEILTLTAELVAKIFSLNNYKNACS
jgi:hypothetical protein